MKINQNLLTELNNYNVEIGERLLWIALRLETPDPDGFFLLKVEDWSEKYDIPKSTLTKYLSRLEDKHLIRKDYRGLSVDSPYPIGGGGKFLFVQVLDPQSEDNMTFFGKFCQIDTQILSNNTVSKIASFKDVYNLAYTLNFKYAFCDLKENDANFTALKNMERGDPVAFKGKVKRREGKAYIANIWNIIPAGDYYANRGN